MSSADAAEATDEVVEIDERRDGVVAVFAEHLGDSLLESHVVPGHEVVLRVHPDAWKQAHRVARFVADFRFFEFVSAMDWMPSPWGKSENASIDEPESSDAEAPEMTTGLAGGETRFQVFSRLMNIEERDLGVVFKADVPSTEVDGREVPGSVDSIIEIFPGANWHERECHEMFGIGFDGHPFLAPLYLPSEFEGNPLRKDFPLLSRHVKPWPGIVDVEPMPEDDDADEAAEGEDA